jgi:hypothetical protein
MVMTKTGDNLHGLPGTDPSTGPGGTNPAWLNLRFLFQFFLSVFEQVVEFPNQLQKTGMVLLFLD